LSSVWWVWEFVPGGSKIESTKHIGYARKDWNSCTTVYTLFVALRTKAFGIREAEGFLVVDLNKSLPKVFLIEDYASMYHYNKWGTSKGTCG